MTENELRTAWKEIINSGVSYRNFVKQNCPAIPPGTVCNFIHGKPMPEKWLDYCHITRKHRKQKTEKMLPWHDRSKRDLMIALLFRREYV